MNDATDTSQATGQPARQVDHPTTSDSITTAFETKPPHAPSPHITDKTNRAIDSQPLTADSPSRGFAGKSFSFRRTSQLEQRNGNISG